LEKLDDMQQKLIFDASQEIETSSTELVKVKVRAVGSEFKRFQRTLPVGVQQQALFGLNTVKPDSKSLVITEGEYDAMAVHQETGMATVSLP
jgi:twinkle protein